LPKNVQHVRNTILELKMKKK